MRRGYNPMLFGYGPDFGHLRSATGMSDPKTPREVFVATTCLGKFAYDSPQLAWRQLKVQAKKRRRAKRATKGGAADQRPYRCQACGRWHVGGGK